MRSEPQPLTHATTPLHLPSHTATVRRTWQRLCALTENASGPVVLNGNDLDIAALVAVAHHAVRPTIQRSSQLRDRLLRSVEVLNDYLSSGWTVYGVNTGFGGSADTRTDDLRDLQLSLLQHTQSAIIPLAEIRPDGVVAGLTDRQSPHTVPRPWVKAAILVRANQNLRGHSAVRLEVIENLVGLLRHDITPIVPLRGTISASGDLMPLSYIAGTLTANPDIFVQLGNRQANRIVPSSEALAAVGMAPSELEPKEGLGLINGTAPSAALAALVMYRAQQLAVVAQMLTALTAEALAGNVEWADEFVHAARPHPGQAEVAENIRSFLAGSELVTGLENRRRAVDGLCQDRYSTRTAAQWIGPYLEDLTLAQHQVETELNSSSDNPLCRVDQPPSSGDVFSGGNFQATSITSAMDKTRLAMQMTGRILFSQATELINPATNNGLDPNLNALDHRGRSFTMKGIDVNVAAYMSELAALAHPVSAHVLSAEMHNQGVNSLAFISARRTMEAVDLVAHIAASHLFVVCQAIELRVLHEDFVRAAKQDSVQWFGTEASASGPGPEPGLSPVSSPTPPFPPSSSSSPSFAQLSSDRNVLVMIQHEVHIQLSSLWYRLNQMPPRERCAAVADAMLPLVIGILAAADTCGSTGTATTATTATGSDSTISLAALAAFRGAYHVHLTGTLARVGLESPRHDWEELRGRVSARLGSGTGRLYGWVRGELGLRMHMGLSDDPLVCKRDDDAGTDANSGKTIGTLVSTIYDSIMDGRLTSEVMEATL